MDYRHRSASDLAEEMTLLLNGKILFMLRVVIGIALMALVPVVHAETKVQLATGADYSSGDFGSTTKTNVLLAPIGAKISNGNWTFRVSVPYVSISGPSNVTVVIEDSGGGSNSGSETDSGRESSGSSSSSSSSGSDDDGGSSGGGTTATTVVRDRTVSGIGDTTLSATYSFNSIADSPAYIDVIGRVRLPTGDEVKGTGTGATDYIAQTEAGFDAKAGGMYLTGGRRFLGSTKLLKRVSGWQAGAGAWVNMGNSVVLGTYYDWRQASTLNSPDPSEVGAYLTLKLSTTFKMELNAGKSLHRTGADYSAGVMFSWRVK
ncbi:MAG: hypothetical protein ABUL52_00005 [Solimonas sp.]